MVGYMKIAFHFPRLAAGGVEKMRIILAKELLARGIDVDFVLCQSVGEYKNLVPEGVVIHDLGAKRTRNSLIPLVRYIKKNKPDALFSSLGPQNILAVLANKLSGSMTKVFVTQHNSLTKQSRVKATMPQRLMPWLYKVFLPMADGVIAVSSGIAKDMAVASNYPVDKINVIYNPACPNDINEKINEEINEKFFNKGRGFILSIGRLVYQKGYDDLIKAFKIVALKKDDLDLVIIGVGPLEEELKKLATELNISNRIHFVGYQDNPVKFIAKAKLFVMSSRYEGFGNVLVEALACGTKVVSTDCEHGPSEILENGKYGALLPVGNVKILAETIIETLDSNVDQKALIARAKLYSASKIVDQYLNVFSKC